MILKHANTPLKNWSIMYWHRFYDSFWSVEKLVSATTTFVYNNLCNIIKGHWTWSKQQFNCKHLKVFNDNNPKVCREKTPLNLLVSWCTCKYLSLLWIKKNMSIKIVFICRTCRSQTTMTLRMTPLRLQHNLNFFP